MCVNPGYGGNAPAECVDDVRRVPTGRTHEDARSVARSAPTRQPSLAVRQCTYDDRRDTLSGTSARASAEVPCHTACPSGSSVRQPTSPARSDMTPALASRRAHRRGITLTTTFRELG